MVRPLRINLSGALYHVISRGNARQEIFLHDDDRRQFLELLAAAVHRFGLRCHAYCLMPNHFHLILQLGEPTLGRTMQQLNAAYAGWFNRRHQRVGHLFQGRFKAPIIEDGSYFCRAVRYVVQNPVRAGLCPRCADWEWSSYRATVGLAHAPSWLAVEDIWGAFGDDAKAACRGFADYCETEETSPTAIEAVMCGSDDSLARLSEVLAPKRTHREFIYAQRFADRPSLRELFAEAHDARRRDEAARTAFADHGYTLCEIGAFLQVAPGTIWRHIRGLAGEWKPRRNGTSTEASEKIEI